MPHMRHMRHDLMAGNGQPWPSNARLVEASRGTPDATVSYDPSPYLQVKVNSLVLYLPSAIGKAVGCRAPTPGWVHGRQGGGGGRAGGHAQLEHCTAARQQLLLYRTCNQQG